MAHGHSDHISSFRSFFARLFTPKRSFSYITSMHGLSFFFVFLTLPLAGLAGRYSGIRPRYSARSALNVRSDPQRTFKLVDLYQGADFFKGWDFFNAPDPTNGNVEYLSKEDAFAAGLAFVQQDNTAVLAVDDQTVVPAGGKRKSVRIATTKTYTTGLFIADIFAMPHGCSVWPAYWSVGPDWPNNGEIDVIENVNTATNNLMTLHTSEGCTLDGQTSPNRTFNKGVIASTSRITSTQCASGAASNTGCAFVDTTENSYGHGFNIIAGGVYAHLWTDDAIQIWHFPRDQVPGDIDAKNPDPSTWPPPVAVFTSASCNIPQHFNNHQLVFDTTLCGDFAGSAYPQSGCPGTCADAVADPSNFRFAKWKVNYVAVYN